MGNYDSMNMLHLLDLPKRKKEKVQMERYKNWCTLEFELETKGPFDWEMKKWEEMEKWRDKKNFSSPSSCLIGKVEKQSNRKLFCLVEKKNERIKNVYII